MTVEGGSPMESRQMDRAAQLFPLVDQLGPASRESFAVAATAAQIPAGSPIARAGDACEQIALIAGGEVRVHKTSRAGRDLTLYRIFPGQTCVLTSLCLLSRQDFPADADAVTDTEAFLVPRRTFEGLFAMEPAWRQFIFRTMSERMVDLLSLIDGVLFTDLPSRLADALLTQQQDGQVLLTHEQLAGEVGSSREVVSRVLKTWERQGLVSLARGRVVIASPAGLLRLLER